MDDLRPSCNSIWQPFTFGLLTWDLFSCGRAKGDEVIISQSDHLLSCHTMVHWYVAYAWYGGVFGWAEIV